MSKTLIAYFSHSGENYMNGNIVELPVGNTAIVADKIHLATSYDIFEIETVKPYPFVYSETTAVAKEELEKNDRPLLKNSVENMESYDRLLLGYPNWWGTVPMAICTFLENQCENIKEIYPFCTHEGSGAGKSQRDIRRICCESEVYPPLEIEGNTAKNADHKINEWLKYYKFS